MIAIRTKSVKFHIFLFSVLNEPFPKKQLNIEKDKTKQVNENFKSLQNYNKSLIVMVKSSEQNALIYKSISDSKDLDQLKKEVSKIVKSFLNKKSVKLSKKEIDCLTYEFRKNIKRNHLESNESYKDVAVDDVTKVKIKEKIELYIKIQQEVKNILGNFFLEANSESQIQKFSWEFYKQIRATYDEIPPGLKGGMMVDDEERMTLTEDFSKQMSDSITFQMTRNKRS